MSAISEARGLVEDAIAAIDKERDQLERFLGHLRGSGDRSPTKRTRRASDRPGRRQSTTRRKGSGRAKRGQRIAEVLSDIQAHPNTRPSETAKRLKIANAQVSTAVRRLVVRGDVAKRDGRLKAAK